jgi:hypothetical protein
MKFKPLLATTMLTLTLVNLKAIPTNAEEYSFTITNEKQSDIVAILTSENEQKWERLDFGNATISQGESMELGWDETTNDYGCIWWIKAVFSDGSESKSQQFNFCESGLELVY